MISVLLITYNRLDMLKRAVKSFLTQTHKEKELIIIDDGSTDKTPDGEDPVLQYGELLAREHMEITFYKMGKNNPHDAMCLAMDFSTGDICVILHDDDEFNCDTALDQYQEFFDRNAFDVAYTSVNQVRDGVERLYRPGAPNFEKLLKSEYFHYTGMAFRRAAFPGWADEDIRYQSDYWFKLKCFMTARVGWLDSPVYRYNLHPGQDHNFMTAEIRKRENEIIFRRLGLDIPK